MRTLSLLLLLMVLVDGSSAVAQELAAKPPTQPATQAAVEPSFAPVIESVMPVTEAPDSWLFDLDTGKRVSGTDLPPKTDLAGEEGYQWQLRTGAEAAATVREGNGVILAYNTHALPIKNAEWDTLKAREVTDRLTKLLPPPEHLVIMGAPEFPTTYAFQTPQGAGLLQIVGLSDEPKGIKVHIRPILHQPPVLQIFDWSQLAAQKRLLDGALVSLDGRSVLKLENPGDTSLQLTLLKIDHPAITAMRYGFLGQIKYDHVEGIGYLESCNDFPAPRPGKSATDCFSRTLADAGPMAKITGTSDWRPFSLPFDRADTSTPATSLELSIKLPPRATVYIGSVTLTQMSATATPLTPPNPPTTQPATPTLPAQQ